MPWRYSKSEVTIIQAPIKGMPQMDQKTWEKHRGYYSHIKDVARITMKFTTVAAFLEAISESLMMSALMSSTLFFLLRKSFYDFLVF